MKCEESGGREEERRNRDKTRKKPKPEKEASTPESMFHIIILIQRNIKIYNTSCKR
jgi:hypothetical protein